MARTAVDRLGTASDGVAGLAPAGWWPGFLALSAIWGASFALIRAAEAGGVTPVWVAFWRCAFGAATLWLLLAGRREPVPRDRALWLHSAVVAVLLNAVPFTLVPFGETRISTVLAGVWNATTPLFTLVAVRVTTRTERLGGRRAAALGLGFLGVLVVLDVRHGLGSGQLTGSLACLGAAACYGAGFAYLRRFLSGRPESSIALSAVQIGCAAAELAVAAPLLGGLPQRASAGAAVALLALGALGTGVAYILNLRLVRTAGTTVASTVTYAIPLWSTSLGALLLAEPVGWSTLVGGVLVIGAIALTRR